MSGHPEGRGRADSIFWQKLNLGNFSKLCLHGEAYNLERLFEKFSDIIFSQPERRRRANPLSENVENVCIIPILVSNKLVFIIRPQYKIIQNHEFGKMVYEEIIQITKRVTK